MLTLTIGTTTIKVRSINEPAAQDLLRLYPWQPVTIKCETCQATATGRAVAHASECPDAWRDLPIP